ncbi:arsenic resistance protein [Alkalicoccobacillus murimartini]|uniref:ACR3 family arsenite efflux pump ArsB n=1 Tax=Alkalicoccobacillus murimartini TaxID=171685 RepID=A0ABT9YMD4_9BACI|nr:bile acid:sodium symporter [Alkalicoccobacillus murimartini]MDQ0208753.1 ACR3 family arsenite efflux pump ArsB [Alkalicoccobacillus murimartini]
MNSLEKLQTILIFAAVMLGLGLGQISIISSYSGSLIIPFLFIMLYGLFLTIPLTHLKKAFMHSQFLSISTIINFVWTPLLAWGLGAVFLSDHPALWIGFVMLMVTPCTDWYLIFTSIAKGNVALAASVLPINLILQMLLLPVYLWIFAGTSGTISLSTIGESVLLVFILPFGLALLTRLILKKKSAVLEQKVIPFFASAQLIFLCLAIVAMFASQGAYLWSNMNILYLLLLPILFYFIINFGVAQLVGKCMKMPYEDSVSLHFTIIARNSPVALAVAITAFPDQPVVALALVIGPLLELPVLAIVSQVLLRIRPYR